jgi:hypothetical protein
MVAVAGIVTSVAGIFGTPLSLFKNVFDGRKVTEELSRRAFMDAWALPVRDTQSGDSRLRRWTFPYDDLEEHFHLVDGDAVRVLSHWSKSCWQNTGELPPWMLRERRELFGASHERAPDFTLVRSTQPPAMVVAVGMRLIMPRESGDGHWATDFEEARRSLLAGARSPEWFEIQIDATHRKNVMWIHQRGYAPNMRDWRPICRSSGASATAILERPVSFGSLKGAVTETRRAGSPTAGRRIAGATLSFEHEDGVTRRVVTSDADGRYELSLPYGRYHCVVTHPNYAPYSTEEGWGIVDDKSDGFWNFDLTALAAR